MGEDHRVSLEKVEAYLQEAWRTRAELRVAFGMSNTESFRLLRWYGKLKILETVERSRAGVRNKVFLYRIKT